MLENTVEQNTTWGIKQRVNFQYNCSMPLELTLLIFHLIRFSEIRSVFSEGHRIFVFRKWVYEG